VNPCTACGTTPTNPQATFCGSCGVKLPAATQAAAERPNYITLPPGVVPVAATNTGPAPSPVSRAPSQSPSIPVAPQSSAPIVPPTVVAPAPAALPAPPAPAALPAPPAPSAVVPPHAPPPAGPEPVDVGATRAAAPRRTLTWSLVFPDGTSHPVSTSVVIGRAPDHTAHGAAAGLSVGAGEKSVSKSHALLEMNHAGLRVRDLGSVNGVVVVHLDGTEAEASSTVFVDLKDGDELELGEVVISVRAV
jgi:hypothetical protein